MNDNKTIIIFLALLIVAIAIIIFSKKAPKKITNSEEWPFFAKRLLSQPEQIIYHRLVEALPNHIVLAQVQLSRVLGIKKGFNFNQWNNRINQKSLDFVICNKDFSVVSAIELDDKTHEKESRKYADETKDKALNSANVKIIRWNVKNMPDIEEIRKSLTQN